MKNFSAKFVFFFFISLSALAFSPESRLPNEADEQRARQLFLQVRCLVCNGQVIENSFTEFSYQMRQNIRVKIAAGKTNEEIKSALVEEFGDDILVAPTKKNKILLMLLPLGVAIGLGLLAIKFFRQDVK